jgi:hypothetical protein
MSVEADVSGVVVDDLVSVGEAEFAAGAGADCALVGGVADGAVDCA